MDDSTDPRLTPLAASLPATVPFTGPEVTERATGRKFTARLGANESVFGPSPKVIDSVRQAADLQWQYGDSASHDLRHALAAHHGCAMENIVVGEGIDGLLGLLVRLLVTEGTPVVTSNGAYPTFNYHVTGHGGTLHKVPYTGDYEDPERLVSAAKKTGARLIYIANPDNPMGSCHDAETIERMVLALPEDALLILDEAYADFAPASALARIAADDPRVIRMRTFSKAYGLAGARVGYAIGPRPLIAAFDRVRNHFGIAKLSQIAALAAFEDQDWLAEVQRKVEASKTRIAAIAAENGLTALPSSTSFVAVDCTQDGAFAAAVLDGLLDRGIFVRMPGVAPLNRCIRISCGAPADLDLLAAALPDALRDARNR